MSRYKNANNPFVEIVYEDEPCVEFETVGSTRCKVLVDREDWFNYLKNYSWTAIKSQARINVKTSIDKQSIALWRVIVEHNYSELDYWGTTIDHINNNPLDNRLKNLRIYNSILNSTNISSKYADTDMQFIHRQGPETKPNGFKVHYNLNGKTFYKNFGVSQYGGVEEAIQAAKKYRDETVIPQRELIIEKMIKKTRDIEFERGLRDKILAGETDEIIKILNKYNIEVK